MADTRELNTRGDQAPSAPPETGRNFDFNNWFYWSMWWQQFIYWQSYWAQQYRASNPSNNSSPRSLNSNLTGQQQWWNEYYRHWGQQLQQRQSPQSQSRLGMSPFVQPAVQPPGIPPALTVQIRFISGFETFIPAAWRRLVAELIDMAIFSIVLKLLFPMIDYRIPEAVFLGADVVLKMEDAELDEMGDTMINFFYSIMLERTIHALVEAVCTRRYGCTLGKWIMGLRIYRCNVAQYTRTEPGRSIKVEPGTNLTFAQAIIRAVFKAVVSLFCPLVIFFVVLDRGRTQYDKLFNSVVVDHFTLYRPIFMTRTQRQNIHVQQM